MRVERSRTTQKKTDTSFLTTWREQLLDRRTFLARLAGVSVAALFPLSINAEPLQPGEWHGLTDKQQTVLAAVQQHLFPSEPGIPGAREINALPYLDTMLSDPKLDPAERDFVVNGIGWLESLVGEDSGRSFTDLDEAQREQMLRRIEQSSAGENWLATILMYLFEALLSDPAYGGNPNGIGWQWLAHTPGFPRPPADKLYGKL